jgi:hypothetical protein
MTRPNVIGRRGRGWPNVIRRRGMRMAKCDKEERDEERVRVAKHNKEKIEEERKRDWGGEGKGGRT